VRKSLGIDFYHCPGCRGAWLSRESIESLSDRTGLFLKSRAFVERDAGRRQPLWREIFDGE
jgi:Zn-finger nucleic acid-binding protein